MYRWKKGNPYLYLLSRYLHYYIPVDSPLPRSPAAHDPPDHNLEFLQLMVDYWVDTVLVVKHDFHKVTQYKEENMQQRNQYFPRTTSASSLSSSTVLTRSGTAFSSSSSPVTPRGHGRSPRSGSGHMSSRNPPQQQYQGMKIEQ